MSITRFFYEPFYPLSEFESFFDEAFARNNQHQHQSSGINTAFSQSLKPRMNLHESGQNALKATFELPGLKKEKEGVDISIHNSHLTISGESKASANRKEGEYAIRERQHGRFSRTLQLPQGVKDEEIKASMQDGILTVTFPKSAPELAPKKIAAS